MPRILIVEDRDSLRRMLVAALEGEGHEVEAAPSGEAGIERLRAAPFDLLLTDLKLPGVSGLEVLAASREARPAAAVIVMTGYGTVKAAVEAMKLGARDFLEKPVEMDELFRLVAAALGGDPPEATFQPPGGPVIVGRHPALRTALRLLERVGPTDSTVLLTGESGTGKEVFARAIHAVSRRRAGPFVAVSCAAIPEALLENELFGHERGAFTGASRRTPGRFERAAGGTLLLDEIGELPLGVQAKVLRVLEERTFERVGGEATLKADVRLVAATNRELGAMVEGGEFRRDLFFRLDVFPIHLPPLRERATDIPLLARHLLAEVARRHRLAAQSLSPAAERFLAEQRWPGNVRELGNLLERVAIMAAGRARLEPADLRPLLTTLATGGERERLRDALRESGGDKRRAGALLGVSYRTVLRWVKEWGLEGFPKYRE
jgi:DNA-binding NtrC family response regulator